MSLEALRATAIASNDDEDRKVLADWYAAHDDDARARVILLAIELRQLGRHERAHLDRTWELDAALGELGDRWRDELPVLDGIEWTTLDRGLASGVKVRDVAALYEHAAAIRAAAPVTRVEIGALEPAGKRKPLHWLRTLAVGEAPTGDTPAFYALASWVPELELAGSAYDSVGWLGRTKGSPLERLAIQGTTAVGAELAQRLVAEKLGTALVALAIGSTWTDPNSGYADDPRLLEAGARQLAKLTSLEVLAVDRQNVGAAGLGKLATLPALRELSARACCSSLAPFAKAQGVQLEALDLSENALGLAGAKQLAKAPRAAMLHRLVLDTCELDAFAVGELIAAPAWPHLRVLDLSRNPLRVSAIRTLAAGRRPAELHTLRLEDADLDETAPEALAKIAWLDQLAVLSLSGNAFARGLAALRGIAFTALRHLSLASTRMERSEATLLSRVWPQLVHLDLGNNPLTDFGIERFATTKPAPALQTLVLRDCNLGDDGLELLERIRTPRLRSLDLAGNAFGAAALARLLRSPCVAALETLNLSRCKLSGDALALFATVPLPPRLRTLKLRHNDFDPALHVRFAESATLARVRDVYVSGVPGALPAATRELLARRFGALWYQDPRDPLVE